MFRTISLQKRINLNLKVGPLINPTLYLIVYEICIWGFQIIPRTIFSFLYSLSYKGKESPRGFSLILIYLYSFQAFT